MTGYAVADPKLSSATSTAACGTSIRRLTSGKCSIWERNLCMRPKLFGRSSTDRSDLEISNQEPAIDRQSRPGRKTARQAHRVTAAVGARNPGSDGHFAIPSGPPASPPTLKPAALWRMLKPWLRMKVPAPPSSTIAPATRSRWTRGRGLRFELSKTEIN